MKVLMINSVCGIRSTGRICTDLADELSALGYECKIAYGRESVPEKYQKYAVRIGNNFDVKINALKSRIFDNEGFNAKRQTKKLISFIEEFKPDIIHLHNLHGYYLNLKILFEYLSKQDFPVIYTLHDSWSVTGHCTNFETCGCEKWKTGCENCSEKNRYPQSLFLNRSKKNFKEKKQLLTDIENLTIITPSIWLKEIIKQSFLQNKRVEVINNGIDINTFKPTDSRFRVEYELENKFIVLGVATAWGEKKGLYDFIKLSNMIGNDKKIVLVGLTENQIKKLPPNIIGIERTNSTKELAEIYSAADIYLNLTYADNYPTTNLEAQACGTTVLTYKTGGSPESAGPDAILVEQGNINEVSRILNNLEKKQLKEINSFELSTKRMIQEYIKTYNSINTKRSK